MAWRSSSALVSNILCRHSKSHFAGPLVRCNSIPVAASYCNQFRSRSDVPLQDLTEHIKAGTDAVTPLAAIFSDSAPVLATQDLLCQLHNLTGLTWAPTIVLATIGVRLFVGLPISVLQQKSIAKLQNLQPALLQLRQDLTRETFIATKLYKWNQKTAQKTFKRSLKKHWRRLMEENNCHPFRSIALSTLQIPAWICLSSAIRNMAYMLPTSMPENLADQQYQYMQLFVEKSYWLDSLVLPDPFILPGIFILANLINIQIHRGRNLDVPQTKLQKVVPVVFGGIIVGVGIFATYVPAAVSLYWATSSVSALAVNSALMLPFISSKLGYARSSKKFLKFPSLKLPKLIKPKSSAV